MRTYCIAQGPQLITLYSMNYMRKEFKRQWRQIDRQIDRDIYLYRYIQYVTDSLCYACETNRVKISLKFKENQGF